MKRVNYNSYDIGEKRPLFMKLALLSTFGAALVGTFFFFPLLQILQANGAPSFFQELVYYLSEAVSATALFTLLGLLVIAISHEEKALVRKLFLYESVALLLVSFLLRLLLFLFTAWLDDKLYVSFYFNDTVLDALLAQGGIGLIAWGLYTLLGVVTVILTVGVTYFWSRKVYKRWPKRGVVPPFLTKIPVLVYIAVTLVSALINTVYSLIVDDFAFRFSVIVGLLMPYVELVAFALLGYYFMAFFVSYMEKTEKTPR